MQGYTKELFLLPFDHRTSFQRDLLQIAGKPSKEQAARVSFYKKIVFDGFKKAIALGVPKQKAGILVDEQYGKQVLLDAKKKKFIRAMPVEKSGQKEFNFEYGSNFKQHILRFKPTFVKVLVRYHPIGDKKINERQLKKLRALSNFLEEKKIMLLFELLVESSEARKADLIAKAIQEIQRAGVKPSIWKIEGIGREGDLKRIVEQASSFGKVGVIILGRGESRTRLKKRLSVAARVKRVTGFAIGRTVFMNALKKYRDKKISREQAVQEIAGNYEYFVDLWQKLRGK